MRRRLFTLCSALSLLLCIGAAGMWVRSYRIIDVFQSYRSGRYWQIVLSCGQLHLEVGPTSYPDATT